MAARFGLKIRCPCDVRVRPPSPALIIDLCGNRIDLRCESVNEKICLVGHKATSGCNSVGRMLALGARCREFKSRHSDLYGVVSVMGLARQFVALLEWVRFPHFPL